MTSHGKMIARRRPAESGFRSRIRSPSPYLCTPVGLYYDTPSPKAITIRGRVRVKMSHSMYSPVVMGSFPLVRIRDSARQRWLPLGPSIAKDRQTALIFVSDREVDSGDCSSHRHILSP